jgi:hypothetical protein
VTHWIQGLSAGGSSPASVTNTASSELSIIRARAATNHAIAEPA